MTLREIRIDRGLTQEEAAKLLSMTRRTYIKYENESCRSTSLQYQFMCQTLERYGMVDEEHGVLTLEQIQNICRDVFKQYDVEFCYLFGSYAKGRAAESSDVDLLISGNLSNLEYFDLIERLRERLSKKVELLLCSQLKDNNTLVYEILKDGIKIYG